MKVRTHGTVYIMPMPFRGWVWLSHEIDLNSLKTWKRALTVKEVETLCRGEETG